jgi:hypothetical protein
MKARTGADISAAFRRRLYHFTGALPEPTWYGAVVCPWLVLFGVSARLARSSLIDVLWSGNLYFIFFEAKKA